MQAPRELISTVRIDGLEQTEYNPSIHGQNVEILGDSAPQNRYADSSEPKHHDLDGRGVFSSQPERSRVLMVNLVDVFIEERACMHGAMHPVVPGVFHDEENGNLKGHLVDAGERNGGGEAEVLAHGVE